MVFLDQTKLKAFTDYKLNVIKMTIFVFDTVENIVGKGEIACTSNFFFSRNVFKRLLSQTRQKVLLCGNGLLLFSTVFQLYPCFPGVLLTSTLQNILSKPPAAFLQNHYRNTGQQ